MRYIAKVYVTEVMDQTVVSGYVIDTDPLTDPDHEAFEFTYQCFTPTYGGPAEWLLASLYRCLVTKATPGAEDV